MFDGFVTPPVFDGFIDDGFNSRGLGVAKLLESWSTALPITFVDLLFDHYRRDYSTPFAFVETLVSSYSPTIALTPGFTELLLNNLFTKQSLIISTEGEIPFLSAMVGSPAPATDTVSIHPGWTNQAWWVVSPYHSQPVLSMSPATAITDLGTSLDFRFESFVERFLFDDDGVVDMSQFWIHRGGLTGHPSVDAERILYFFNPNGTVNVLVNPIPRPGTTDKYAGAIVNRFHFGLTLRVSI